MLELGMLDLSSTERSETAALPTTTAHEEIFLEERLGWKGLTYVWVVLVLEPHWAMI